MKRCLGSAYTQAVHRAWVKVYSRMLRTIVPVAVTLELKGQSESQVQRVTMKDTMAISSHRNSSEEVEDDPMPEDQLESEKIRRAELVDKIW